MIFQVEDENITTCSTEKRMQDKIDFELKVPLESIHDCISTFSGVFVEAI